jgi:hypothetical protein
MLTYQPHVFQVQVREALQAVKTVLENAKVPLIADEVSHAYVDKYFLVQLMTNTSIASHGVFLFLVRSFHFVPFLATVIWCACAILVFGLASSDFPFYVELRALYLFFLGQSELGFRLSFMLLCRSWSFLYSVSLTSFVLYGKFLLFERVNFFCARLT